MSFEPCIIPLHCDTGHYIHKNMACSDVDLMFHDVMCSACFDFHEQDMNICTAA